MKIININELVNILGVSKTTLWRWRKEGDFPEPIILGKNIIVWKESQIEEWLNNKKIKK